MGLTIEHLEIQHPNPEMMCEALRKLLGGNNFKIDHRSPSGTIMAILGACIGLEIRVGPVSGSVLGFRWEGGTKYAKKPDVIVREELFERLSADAFEHGQWEQKGGVWVLPFAVEKYPCHAIWRGGQHDIRNCVHTFLADAEPE